MQATRCNRAGTPHVNRDLLPITDEEKEALTIWLTGKSLPVVEGVPNTAHLWDIERWAKNLPRLD